MATELNRLNEATAQAMSDEELLAALWDVQDALNLAWGQISIAETALAWLNSEVGRRWAPEAAERLQARVAAEVTA